MDNKEDRIQGALGLVTYEVTFYDNQGNFTYSMEVKVSDENQAKELAKQEALDAGIEKKALKFVRAVKRHT